LQVANNAYHGSRRAYSLLGASRFVESARDDEGAFRCFHTISDFLGRKTTPHLLCISASS
jgi:hypothetical protein